MTSRERVIAALKHEEPDRVPIDLGGMLSTGVMATAYVEFKKFLGIETGRRVRVYDVMQQLAVVEPEVLEAVGGDVLPLFIEEPKEWRVWTLPDGTKCEVPDWFRPQRASDGSLIWRDEGSGIVYRMPKGGLYFDMVERPLERAESERDLDKYPFFRPLSEEALTNLRERARKLYEETNYAIMLNGAGNVYEQAQFLRGWDAFLVDLISNPKFAEALLDRITEAAIGRLGQVLPAVEGYVQVIQVGDDLGTQEGPQVSPELYRKIVKPYHKKLWGFIKENSSAFLFLHTCGAVVEFIPDFVEMGVDALNPVQVSARGMDTRKLKREFGRHITFWGGGCDTQKVLQFGTPREVEEEVRRRISDLAPEGGFVFCQVHNIQAGTPPQNIAKMFETARRFGRYG